MDKKTVFVKTSKGVGEAANQSDHLYGDAKRVLLLVDDDSTVAEISKRAPPSLRATLEDVLQDLVDSDFIRDRKEPENAPQKSALKFATPKFASPKAAASAPEKVAEQEMELDFSFIAASPAKPTPPQPAPPAPTPPKPSEVNPEVAKAQARAQVEAKAKQEAEAARLKAAQQAQIEATAGAAKAKAYAEAKAKAKAEVETRARAEAEARIKHEAEAARLKAEKEAAQMRAEQEAAKAKAELELRARAIAATRIKQEAEAARLKAENEAARARAELEAAKIKMEAEIRARVEVEARAKQEAEVARLKAEREAAQARAELEAARVKAEAETRARIESEARVKAEVEARIKLEAEEARLKAENEEAQARARLAEAKAKAEAETKARIETEARVKAEVEAQLKREAEEVRQKTEREEMAARSSLEMAKAKAEAEVRQRIEAEARIRAEVEARILQEEEDARLQAARMLVELDAVKAKAEADAKALVEAAARIKAEAEARFKQDEEEALIKAEKERADALIDPAEKIRQSFASSAATANGNQNDGAHGFKFDSFSVGQAASATIPPQKMGGASGSAQNTTSGGSKVKAAVEQRAQKDVEAQRLKAEQDDAKLRAEQESAARIAAEKETARLKAEHEAYKAKVEQEEARAKAVQEASKQAAEQSKAWEAAEQRAKVKAQSEKDRLEKQLTEAPLKSGSKSPKVRRKPLPVGKIFAGLLVAAILAVAVLPFVWPLDGYVVPLEQELSAQLHQPVHIGKINAALFPRPKLEMHDVTVGSKTDELKIGVASVNFDFSAIFSPTKSINNLQLSRVTLNGQSLTAAVSWLQSAGSNENYPVAHMELQGVRVNSDEIKVPLLNGHADFDTQGRFSKSEIKSEDGKFGLELESVQKHLQVVVNFRDTSLPMLPGIPFIDFSATGEILNGEIVFSDLYGHFYGGMLGGNARLNWQNGWLLQGRVIAKSLELQNLFSQFGISGELYGDVNVTLFGTKLSQIADAPRMEGTFEAKKVLVKKMDIETIARFGNRSDLGRGQTNFDEIKGTLQADAQGQHLRQLEISSGVLSGNGQMDVANQQLSGKFSIELKGAHGGNASLVLSGTTTDPVVKAR